MSTHSPKPAPKIGSRVRVGRHGAPMTVTHVFPVSEVVNVVSDAGVRFTVDFADFEIVQTPPGGTP